VSISDRMFDGTFAQNELECALEEAGVPFEGMGWDHYDSSLELNDVPADHRLSDEAQRIIYDAKFSKVYVNHVDKWETHYTFDHGKPFEPVKGWRVSYPHKRNDGRPGILVEERVETWPAEWFETGYARVKGAP
jgi:hypothetical protein